MIPITATYTTPEEPAQKATIVAILVSSAESYPVIIFINQQGELQTSTHITRFTNCLPATPPK